MCVGVPVPAASKLWKLSDAGDCAPRNLARVTDLALSDRRGARTDVRPTVGSDMMEARTAFLKVLLAFVTSKLVLYCALSGSSPATPSPGCEPLEMEDRNDTADVFSNSTATKGARC